MTLGEKLKSRRTALGLSQEKIAELVGVSRQAVTKWENDQSMPSCDNLMALASIYGVSLDELAGDKQNGWQKENKILHTNLTLIAIIAQAAALNTLIQPVEDAGIPWLRAVELVVKLVPLLGASIWMALNHRYEKNPVQRRKNTRIELRYCLIQLAVVLLCRRFGWYFPGTLLVMGVALLYIFVVNPRYMNRPLTRGPERVKEKKG